MTTLTLNQSSLWIRSFRLGTSVSLAFVVTGLLLILMCSLIAMDPPDIIEDTITIQEVVMTQDRVIVEQQDPDIIKPVDPVDPPPKPEFKQNLDNSDAFEIAIAPPVEPIKVVPGNGFSSGSAMPIFKVAPQYPRRQQSRGVEGYVDLMFDIGPTGKTQNIRVIFSEPEGVFDRASIKALQKWKYKPAIDDGVAIIQKNQTTRISFNLEG